MENQNQSFWQFSDQLRLQSSNLANLSLNDSIWSNSYVKERRNFDVLVGAQINNPYTLQQEEVSNFNGFNSDWKIETNFGGGSSNSNTNYAVNGGFNKGIYSSKPSYNQNLNIPINNNNNKNNSLILNKNYKNIGKGEELEHGVVKSGKKKNGNNNNNGENNKNGADKRFKTLPPSESLPRNETVGGYIFVCNNDTMQENLKRQLFGLPPRYRDSVRAITPGLPLFLYNYSTHQLHGVFEAAGFGGTNIDPTAWEDKKCPGESRFPAQVRVVTRKICEPLEEDAFRPILHHYDGPKFRLELNIPEALSLLDIFAENSPSKEQINIEALWV
ncbi:Development/cell death domain [Dillenia turbinata]|uniref:Development/cell death domain n=1 Tax=Dillenia turbinata TaxID=194707 RepID=A0AAN8WJZ3_9MAGN